jgi:hypothetical protein
MSHSLVRPRSFGRWMNMRSITSYIPTCRIMHISYSARATKVSRSSSNLLIHPVLSRIAQVCNQSQPINSRLMYGQWQTVDWCMVEWIPTTCSYARLKESNIPLERLKFNHNPTHPPVRARDTKTGHIHWWGSLLHDIAWRGVCRCT